MGDESHAAMTLRLMLSEIAPRKAAALWGTPEVIAVMNKHFADTMLAAKAEGVKQERDAIVGFLMTVVESLMEGRMTDAGLTKLDHIKMRAQIDALEAMADEIQARRLPAEVNTAHKNSVEA